MKRILYLLFVFIACLQLVWAQQKPQYTQYVFNNFLLNPAVAGIENYTDVKAGYRSQWTGLQGAPVTSYLTVNAPLGQEFLNGDATAFPANGGINPSSRLYTQNYMAAEPHHGIGASIVSDQAGPINQTTFDLSYAYHLGLAANLNLAVGASAGFNHISLNTALITLENPLDPAISNGNNSQWKPDLAIGAWLYSSNYYVGASVQQLIPQNLYFSTDRSYNQSKTVPQYFLTAGVKVFMTDEITFLPSFLIKVIRPLPVTYDLNGKFSFSDKFWFGGSYRHGDSFGVLAGINVSSFVNVGYSYDITTSALNTVSNGTHEIVIGILLNNRYKVTCPQHQF
ncbi:type IX secretion system membrane protein PorP/SprF [Mucilaginibacter sp. L3T2-6]|uniref:PorP/SprF family type IX secretion system membrane protein n=1 Tax=Mucilaginibacter sp. L3T2-6 TaxID=3062491 RepID=UPI0026756FAD|nr:type IX secretion system membrane protein PorP/SprF [Mucilaginibacter sp. L3T2-6]MDO3640895.1 type IX secretion system membrane protein PorP/SprF [Mucilaginibacter sp. L3T2-6]MDV6213629.1 type IX secretion system membrane protein PorP/SprF [Mucilaginibacter sp. L3T2-6]